MSTLTAAVPAATGAGERLAAFWLGVTVFDYTDAGVSAALLDRNLAAAAKAVSRRKGYLDGRNLAEVFAWLRPGDLIWTYWVNNYLLGNKPAPFDILFWNADTTRISAPLHADFIDVAMDNVLSRPPVPVWAACPLGRMSEFETKIAGASQLDWVKALAASHARFLTDVGTLYANALRSPLANRSEAAPTPEE